MRNIRLTLSYDGTDYVGWQIQPNGMSVQAAVERAIEMLTGDCVSLFAAGRTDSGVHAIGQVANFFTAVSIPCEKFRMGLQRYLPPDIVVREVHEVEPGFHSTYSAKQKRYRYVIHHSNVPNPFVRKYAWQVRGQFDSEAMHAAGQHLLGTHDFRSFETNFPNKSSSVRTVSEFTVRRHPEWQTWSAPVAPPSDGVDAGEFVWIDVVADGFLYNMVRAIVGTLYKVGRRKWAAERVRTILEQQNRAVAGETAPAHGLYLVHVDYGDES